MTASFANPVVAAGVYFIYKITPCIWCVITKIYDNRQALRITLGYLNLNKLLIAVGLIISVFWIS